MEVPHPKTLILYCQRVPAPPLRPWGTLLLPPQAYLDRIIALLRPRSLLVLAVDGVAPLSKIGQQRTRRYTAGETKRLQPADSAFRLPHCHPIVTER